MMISLTGVFCYIRDISPHKNCVGMFYIPSTSEYAGIKTYMSTSGCTVKDFDDYH